ncbi:hypothetical protein JCM1840_004288 [Sporobolomyces johnsonii]
MSSCSFASFLQMRGPALSSVGGGSAADGGPVAVHPQHHHSATPMSSFGLSAPAPAPSPSSSISSLDAASPPKRQRAHSPDHSVSNASLASLSTETITSFPFHSSTASSSRATVVSPSPTTACPVRSILCTSSSPPSTAFTTPFSSPPPTRPVSRRSSTSKSVRFARCTNASVFPTHSTDEYDRSPIIPTCESQSLELKRSCSDNDDDGGWIKCVERERSGEKMKMTPKLPKNSPSMENPVEGVHGLIEGGFFVGEERDQTPSGVSVAVIAEELELVEELELDTDDMLVDDSAEDVEPVSMPMVRLRERPPTLEQDDSSGDDSDSSDPQTVSSSPDMCEDDEAEQERERVAKEKRKQRFGLCSLGRFTRQELFGAHDSLGGF